MRIFSAPEADVPTDLRAQVLALQRQAWPDDEPARIAPTHDPALRPLSLLLVDGDRVVAALDILSKELVHNGERFAASGLSTVVTDERLRGHGHGHRLVAAARETIEASGADLGIFTCDSHLRSFYERAGWDVLPGTVLVGGTPDAPFPSDRFDKVTIGKLFSARALAHGESFVGARVELYPGTIDRLW